MGIVIQNPGAESRFILPTGFVITDFDLLPLGFIIADSVLLSQVVKVVKMKTTVLLEQGWLILCSLLWDDMAEYVKISYSDTPSYQLLKSSYWNSNTLWPGDTIWHFI